MAKRTAPESEEEELSEQEGSEMECGSVEDGEDEELSDVEVDLEFFDPKEQDFHGLRALLSNYLDGLEFNVGELVDAIVKQNTVGTVVKCGDEGNPVGLASVLNFQRYQGLSAVSDAKKFILENCSEVQKMQLFQKMMESGSSGLLLNERLLNCPPQLGPPLQQALFDEVLWATEDEPTEELRNSFKFENYVLMTRVFKDPTMDVEDNKHGKVKKIKSSGPTGFVYIRPEDEFFHQFSSQWFTFPVRNKSSDELDPLRLVMLLPAAQIPQARAALDAVVGNAAQEPGS